MSNELEYLNQIVKFCTDTIDNYRPVNETKTQKACLGLMRRLRDCSLALRLLITESSKVPQLEFSAGIVLRSLLVDSLIGLNMFKILLDCKLNGNNLEEALESFSFKALSDGLDQTLLYIKKSKEHKIIIKTEKDLFETYSNFVNDYIDYIKPYKFDTHRPLIKEKALSSSKLIDDALSVNELKSIITEIWDAFQMYSKVDHFGILYFKVLELGNENPMHNILSRIYLLVSHNAILHLILAKVNSGNSYLKKKSEDSAIYFAKTFNMPLPPKFS